MRNVSGAHETTNGADETSRRELDALLGKFLGTRSSMPSPQAGNGEVSVVIPVLNEADNIGWVLARIPDWVSEVVLVDGLSVDQTELIARQLRPDLVVVHQRRPGKGAALRAGFAAARGEYVVMIDGDGSTDPAEMGHFVDALRDGADFVKGSRYLPGGGSADFTALRSAGNRALALLTNLLYGSRFTDLCYGYCAFRRCHIEALSLSASGFEIETELALHAVRAELEIREVPSYELRRRAGVSNLRAYRDGRRVLSKVLDARKVRPPQARPGGSAIELLPMQVSPVHAQQHGAWERRRVVGHGAWERRRAERRRPADPNGKYTGPERRRKRDRRCYPALVYMAIEG
jgi:hypothetical protein